MIYVQCPHCQCFCSIYVVIQKDEAEARKNGVYTCVKCDNQFYAWIEKILVPRVVVK